MSHVRAPLRHRMKAKSAAGTPTQKKIALAAKELGLKRNLALAESGGARHI